VAETELDGSIVLYENPLNGKYVMPETGLETCAYAKNKFNICEGET
jgi:hypothetical protein